MSRILKTGTCEFPARWLCIFLVLITQTTDAALIDSAFIPGKSYFGRNQYIEYIAGNTPYIISAPHGGLETPPEIPDRTYGETVTDSYTQDLVRRIGTAVYSQEGKYPHIIICRLSRRKLDANRDLFEAAQGNLYAIQAWKEFHSFIDTAKQTVMKNFGRGFYVDLHGHGHPNQRLELGYLLDNTRLALPDAELNRAVYGNASSIRTLIQYAQISFSQLVRGPKSLGTFFEQRGFPATPSEQQPSPNDPLFFSGGYSTQRHGSSSGSSVSGVQIECNMIGVRDTEDNRVKFAAAIAEILQSYTALHLFRTAVGALHEKPLNAGSYHLSPNYPNPFNARTMFDVILPQRTTVSITVRDLLGRRINDILNTTLEHGVHQLSWDAGTVPSGMYIIECRTLHQTLRQRVILMK